MRSTSSLSAYRQILLKMSGLPRVPHSRAIDHGTMLEIPQESAARKLPRPLFGTRARDPRVSLWFSIESLNRLATKAGHGFQKPNFLGAGAARTTRRVGP